MRDAVPTDRRKVLRLATAAVLTGSALGSAGPAFGQALRATGLLAAPPLPDIWRGSEGAPVTIIEYASTDCSHCAAFHAETWPRLKSKYIDTGKARFVLREFSRSPLATAAFMQARCIGADKRDALIDLMFYQQDGWAFVAKPVEALEETVKQAGITHDAFNACIRDQSLYGKINAEREMASERFGVHVTPTFFINGEMYEGALSVQEVDSILGPLVRS